MAAKLLRSESASQNAPLICRKTQKRLEVTDTFNIGNEQGKGQEHCHYRFLEANSTQWEPSQERKSLMAQQCLSVSRMLALPPSHHLSVPLFSFRTVSCTPVCFWTPDLLVSPLKIYIYIYLIKTVFYSKSGLKKNQKLWKSTKISWNVSIILFYLHVALCY